jgi:hypothetical protein
MGNAKRDQNYVPTLIAVSNADGVTPVTLYADPTTHRLLVSTAVLSFTARTYSPAAADTATLDLGLSNLHFITMPAGNITIALSNDSNNQVFLITITQDSAGSRTVNWFTTIKWADGTTPTLTATANKRDSFCFYRTGSGTYDGVVIGQNF